MPLLLTQDDLRPLIEGPMFFTDLFQVIRDALLRQQSGSLGHLSWLAFPWDKKGGVSISTPWLLRTMEPPSECFLSQGAISILPKTASSRCSSIIGMGSYRR